MPRLKKATDANGVVFYPITISKGVFDIDRNQRLNVTLDDLYSKVASDYSDLYIGTGSTAAEVMVAANHHDAMNKGDHVSLTASSSKVWIILPNTYSPLLTMNGPEIPMTTEESITEGGVTYKVLSSNKTYTGTFNVLLF